MRLARTCLLTLLATLLVACHRAPTEQEKQVVAQLTQSMKTQCMGRYLVDLPDSFKWLHPDVTLYYGKDKNFKTLEVQVLDPKATQESFDMAVGEAAAKIRAETIFGTSTSLLLAQTKSGNGVTMLRYYGDLYGTGVTHQLHMLVGSAHVLIKGSSYEGVPGITDEERDLSPDVEARMLKLATHIHPVTDPEKAGPGFCLGGVVVDSDNDYEQGTLNFVQGTGNSRMMLEVGTSSFKERDPSDPDLIHRDNKYLSLAPSEKSLRQGTLTIGGLPAQEVLSSVALGDKDTQSFAAETSTPRSGSVSHALHFDFEAGSAIGRTTDAPSPLTNNEAIGLWDAILKSVRPRSGAGKPAGE